MIGFKINGGWLELPDDFTLSITRKSPLYLGGDFNLIPGTYSIPATIPASDHNRQKLGYPEYLNNWNFSFSAEIETGLYVDFCLIDKGKLIVTLADPDHYKIQFIASTGMLNGLKTKSLDEYNYGGDLTVPYADRYDYDLFKFHLWATGLSNGTNLERNAASLRVQEVLRHIFEIEGFTWEENLFNLAPELQQLILFYPRRWFLDNGAQSAYLLHPNLHVPRMLVSAFLKNFAKLFCLAIDINSKTRHIRIQENKDILSVQKAVDMTPRLVSHINRKDLDSEVKALEFEFFDEIMINREGAGDLDSKTVSLKGEPIQSTLTPTHIGHLLDKDIIVPVTGVDAYLDYTEMDETAATEQGFILFYREPIPFGGNQDYFASYGNVNHAGSLTGSRSLTWRGDVGLYEKSWKEWLNFINNAAECECTLQFTLNDLINWDDLRPIKLWDTHSGGYHFFFFKERKFVLTMKGIQAAKQKLIQIRD